MATVTKKTVLITGCTTGGIGWAMAKVFYSRGYYIFATVRGGQASKAEGLSELGDVEILDVDVTDTNTISRAKDVVAKRTGGRLDVLMNNAGAEFVYPLLDTDIAEAKKLFDVNVWGPLAMVQTFAPLLVAARGIISNHTSIASVLPLIWAGAYSAAKSAELRFSEILPCNRTDTTGFTESFLTCFQWLCTSEFECAPTAQEPKEMESRFYVLLSANENLKKRSTSLIS